MQDPARADEALANVCQLARVFRGRLVNERQRPKHLKAEVRKQLEGIARQCSDLERLLSELHGETLIELADDPFGVVDLRPKVGQVQAILTLWAGQAVAALQDYESRGRSSSFACREFAEGLLRCWQDYVKPGSAGHVIDPLTEEHSGSFLEFGRACFGPIYRGSPDHYLIQAYRNRAEPLPKE